LFKNFPNGVEVVGLKQVVKKTLPPWVRAALRSAAEKNTTALDFALEMVGRRSLRTWRSLRRGTSNGSLDLAMLCIRRPVYVGLALASVNSLHYHNPAHRVRLYVDSPCMAAYETLKKKLDYPRRVTPVVIDYDPATPWQFKKLEVVLDAFSRGIAFVDADSRWHTDPLPLIDAHHVTFLVVVNTFRTVEHERIMLSEGLGHPDWLDLRHFNTGFIFVPQKMLTERMAERCRSLSREIYRASDGPQFTAEQRGILKHTAEEISLSLAAQLEIGAERIRTLKTEDGPGNRRILESYYYGVLNRSE
jgi:hypothetical protein